MYREMIVDEEHNTYLRDFFFFKPLGGTDRFE